MSRYVAFLRGVSPMNARMAELKACFEKAGFTGVRTVLSSGNVVFTAAAAPESGLAGTIESAMARHLPRSFPVIVRSAGHLRALVESDPYAGFRIPPQAKRVVTFLGKPCREQPPLPIEQDGARILAVTGEDVFTAYVPSADGPVFMALIEKTFGKNVTTRTWDTVRKCVAAA
ncbi:DUF1697 domain-containing protein [Pseudoxanthomonas suwonensis]|uniref:DUF1697 domain-containing protein n=1 Tax=Pseudoxanthomonas suwonensis TaxID=314722 RepID=A0A0E3ULW9_9GAMM|nr:DUF1697 domain-containing protein [Pseudoxanthomonas suwonensis]AKC85515.1 hypothetical protein WQ53_00765 [Pseudoxanthomonas suwonensis]